MEELVDAIFTNQGFYTELGPGRNDGGIDIRLYQNAAKPEINTIVQVKRHKNTNPVELEAVAALYGIAHVEDVRHSIVATSSYFLPVAQKFARTVEKKVGFRSLELANGYAISDWCADISRFLNGYFASGEAVSPILDRGNGPLKGRIVVANVGYNCICPEFAKIEADFPHEALLQPIAQKIVSGDWTNGCVMPLEENESIGRKERVLARKKRDHFWANRELYHFWDGTPQPFNSD